MSSNIFVGLQCCQCSTMQVKQRKKSSNKWTCVVCNQKQSVHKVFAQGPVAKDIRKFVQSFNMARKAAYENQPFDPTSEHDINFEDDGGDLENRRKRRTDWTEYLDSEDHRDSRVVLQEEEQGDDLEPKVVTEMPPKENFKRPKLRNYERGDGGDHQLYKPVFSKRGSRNDLLISQVEKAMRQQQERGDMSRSTSQCSNIATGRGEEESPRDCKSTAAKGNSKWKDYITQEEDDGDLGVCRRRNFQGHVNKWGDAVLETESKYQLVEDDIHPDFM